MKVQYKGWYIVIYSNALITIERFFFKESQGFAVWPLIVFPASDFRNTGDTFRLKFNHERIHLRQQIELLLVFFYIFHFLEWFLHRIIQRKDQLEAYFLYTAEQEAYQHMTNDNYLRYRRFLSMFRYAKKINRKQMEIAVVDGKKKLLIEDKVVFPE